MNFVLLQIALNVGFLALFALLSVYAERKVSAFIQDRLGPMEVGPYGTFQTVADILKLVMKESIIPTIADKGLFMLAPIAVFAVTFAGFAALPISSSVIGAKLETGVLYILAIIAIDVIALLMAGWGANSKYAFLGAFRAVAQMVSYEIPIMLALLAAVMMYGTLDLQEIAWQQSSFGDKPLYLLGLWDVKELGGILSWGVIRYPHLLLAFGVYFIASLAECNRAPFDVPEAESELIAGFHTEYSGFRFAILFLAEYGKMLLVSMIAVVLFLGAWNSPLPNIILGSFELPLHRWTSGMPNTILGFGLGMFWMLVKGLALVGLQMWVRWVYPRVRPDQLMTICWKYLLPAGLILFLISGIWKLAEVYGHLG